MNRAIPDLIQWHDGQLLLPQHFQQLSLRHESLIQASVRAVTFHWGIREFDFDSGDLTMGLVVVRALEAVMPDGCHVRFAPEHDDLRLDLRPLAPEIRRKPMVIHLAMPLADGHTPTSVLRFVSYEGDPVSDDNTGDGAISIPRLRPRLVLLPAADAPSSRYTSFPLLEVRCEGETFMATDFVPPMLVVPTASVLGKRCAELSDRLREKAAQLAERAMLMPQSRFGGEARTQLRSLISALPAFEALRRTDLAHPFSLYLELCRVAGEVSILGHGLLPPLFPVYDHDDARRSFDELMRFITRSVEEGVPDTVRRLSFEQEDEVFRLAADPIWSDAFDPSSGYRFVLAVRSDAGNAPALTWAENCVIGGRHAIRSLLDRRILGVTRRFADRVGELLPPRGLYLFELTPDREDVAADDDLIVLGTTPGIRPEALFLYVLQPDAAGGETVAATRL